MTVLRPGDLVVLKSGGPVMTVDTVNTDIFDDNKVTGVLCAWFVGNKLERARFDCNAIISASLPATARETVESPSAETVESYKTILDDMATALNDAAEASNDVSRTSGGKPRRAVRKAAAEAAVPAARGVN
jgi:uncharacterized protein YodC (DUF2158 family)